MVMMMYKDTTCREMMMMMMMMMMMTMDKALNIQPAQPQTPANASWSVTVWAAVSP